MTTADAIARDLLRIGAVALRPDEPFTWASGRLSPVYTDNRLILSFPRCATASPTPSSRRSPRRARSTPSRRRRRPASRTARCWPTAPGLPFSYVRGAAKGHGRQNRIEGRVEAGQRVVLVEDLVSTGGSVLSAAEALREAGAEVVAVLAVFTTASPRRTRPSPRPASRSSRSPTSATLAEAARESGALGDGALAALRDWRDDPVGWSERSSGCGVSVRAPHVRELSAEPSCRAPNS